MAYQGGWANDGYLNRFPPPPVTDFSRQQALLNQSKLLYIIHRLSPSTIHTNAKRQALITVLDQLQVFLHLQQQQQQPQNFPQALGHQQYQNTTAYALQPQHQQYPPQQTFPQLQTSQSFSQVRLIHHEF